MDVGPSGIGLGKGLLHLLPTTVLYLVEAICDIANLALKGGYMPKRFGGILTVPGEAFIDGAAIGPEQPRGDIGM